MSLAARWVSAAVAKRVRHSAQAADGWGIYAWLLGRKYRYVAAALIVMAPLSLNATSAEAILDPSHNYSAAFDQSETGYTGISVERIDAFVDVPPDGCNGPYQGHPIYQSEWVGALNGSDWLELGTGHQCSNSYQYHYWGYGYNGVWNPIGSVKIGGGEIHTYRITRGADSIWEFRIDGVIKDSFYWARTFPSVSTGLESYAPYGNVNPYNHYHLNYQRLGNTTWNGWDGTDSTLLQNPPMCGLWNNPQSWRTGEASSC